MTEEGPPQLTIGGGEVPSSRANATSSAGRYRDAHLTESQRVILETIRREGSIRSVEAGNIVHARRTPPCYGGRAGAGEHKGPGTAARIGCCGYAATDGLSAMKKLEKRGLVKWDRPGRWVAHTPD
jgi:hypothetical protein